MGSVMKRVNLTHYHLQEYIVIINPQCALSMKVTVVAFICLTSGMSNGAKNKMHFQ